MLFHEPSHALISPRDDPVARAIEAAAEALDVQTPEHLWHGVLFYFSGSALREGLARFGVEHQLLMKTEGIFHRYHDALFTHMPAYLSGEVNLNEAMLAVVRQLSTPTDNEGD